MTVQEFHTRCEVWDLEGGAGRERMRKRERKRERESIVPLTHPRRLAAAQDCGRVGVAVAVAVAAINPQSLGLALRQGGWPDNLRRRIPAAPASLQRARAVGPLLLLLQSLQSLGPTPTGPAPLPCAERSISGFSRCRCAHSALPEPE